MKQRINMENKQAQYKKKALRTDMLVITVTDLTTYF